MKSISMLILVIVYLSCCSAFPADEIINVPGLSTNISFRQYSGYLDIGNGRHYHYWFLESQSKPEIDPVILWLNGGPGASALEGFWFENGPFIVERDGKTVKEVPNSWNTLANVLYLESPVGVGYTYSTAKVENDDDSTAEDNYQSLEKFFKKFPQFSNNSFYITGESYAAVYIPMLALKIYTKNSRINLKGVAIGNGAFDFYTFYSSSVKMAYSHSLIDLAEYNNLVQHCCSCGNDGQVCDFANKSSPLCNPYGRIVSLASVNGINPYNIYEKCRRPRLFSRDSLLNRALNTYFGIDFDTIEESNRQFASRDECENSGFTAYMSLPDVRKAIHIPDHLPAWGTPGQLNYKMQYSSMKSRVKELIEKYKIPTFIVYNGDIDMVCDFLGNQQFVEDLGFKLKEKYRKYIVGGRTAGFVKRYEGISFITVRDSGHLVPTDQPEAALAIIKELIGVSKVA